MTQSQDLHTVTQRWAAAFSAPMPGGLPALLALATEDIHFTDPFNDVRGKPALAAILEDMLERSDAPSFAVHDITASDRAGYIRWSFSCIPEGRKDMWQFAALVIDTDLGVFASIRLNDMTTVPSSMPHLETVARFMTTPLGCRNIQSSKVTRSVRSFIFRS